LECPLDNYIIGIIENNYINLQVVMCSYAVNFLKNSNNLFKQLFLMHLTYFLCKIRVVGCSYRSVNWIMF
jgi:hypothetical protein